MSGWGKVAVQLYVVCGKKSIAFCASAALFGGIPCTLRR